MSSWKQQGGMHKMERSTHINAETIATNTFVFKKGFSGVFDISGSLVVSGNASISGTTQTNSLIVNGTSIFNGSVVFSSDFTTLGNVNSGYNSNISNDVVIGNHLYFSDNGYDRVQSMHGNLYGIGVNIDQPRYAFDIYTNNQYGFQINVTTIDNVNVIAQNSLQQGITTSTNYGSQTIGFYDKNVLHPTAPEMNPPPDAFISYSGNILTIHSDHQLNMTAPIVIYNEVVYPLPPEGDITTSVSLYDTPSNQYYFPREYANALTTPTTGTSMNLYAQSESSNTFVNLLSSTIYTPKRGVAHGGGSYPLDLTCSMGVRGIYDVSGELKVTETVVARKDTVKYPFSMGFSTLRPRDNYSYDFNGPMHIDNGDINLMIEHIPFEIYQLSNIQHRILALGSSLDIMAVDYREQIAISEDRGLTWAFVDISSSLLTDCNALTSISLFTLNYGYIAGNANRLLYTHDGGYTWYRMLTGTSIVNGVNYANILTEPFVATTSRTYFTLDASSVVYEFTIPVTTLDGSGVVVISPTEHVTTLSVIKAIDMNTTTLYAVGGNRVVKYIRTPTFTFGNTYTNGLGGYNYYCVKTYSDTFAICAGVNVISATTDGGTNWTTSVIPNIEFYAIYIYDSANAMAVGTAGGIYTTSNSGVTWNPIQPNLIAPSGKQQMLISDTNHFRCIYMPNNNTVMLVNTTIPYLDYSNVGESEIFAVFIPNWVNGQNNTLLDICGNMNVTGNMTCIDSTVSGTLTTSSPIEFSSFTQPTTINQMGYTVLQSGSVVSMPVSGFYLSPCNSGSLSAGTWLVHYQYVFSITNQGTTCTNETVGLTTVGGTTPPSVAIQQSISSTNLLVSGGIRKCTGSYMFSSTTAFTVWLTFGYIYTGTPVANTTTECTIQAVRLL